MSNKGKNKIYRKSDLNLYAIHLKKQTSKQPPPITGSYFLFELMWEKEDGKIYFLFNSFVFLLIMLKGIFFLPLLGSDV